jgi:hypothetical protein
MEPRYPEIIKALKDSQSIALHPGWRNEVFSKGVPNFASLAVRDQQVDKILILATQLAQSTKTNSRLMPVALTMSPMKLGSFLLSAFHTIPAFVTNIDSTVASVIIHKKSAIPRTFFGFHPRGHLSIPNA